MTYQEAQRILISLGYDLGRGGPSGKGDDGIPGRLSQAAIVAFKRARGLNPTPTIGPQTVAALEAEKAKRTGAAIPAVPSTGLDPVWIIEARRYLGIAEVVGRGSNATILGWAKRLGTKVLGMTYADDDTPWCGLFVAAVIAATLPGEVLPAIVVRASSWDKFGRKLNAPAFGAIARFQRPGGGHVGFVVGRSADGKLLRILGGNQSNRVSETWIEADRLVAGGMRWPSSINSTPEPAPILNAKGAPVSRNEA